MAFLDFEEKHLLGIPEVDEQHKNIYQTVNALYSIKDKNTVEILKVFEKLLDKINQHFKTEENFMIKKKIVHFISHKLEHERAYKKYFKYFEDVKSGKISFDEEIILSLKNWLEAHFEKKDIKLKSFAN
jgi:hemerythrin-like metal-binding protein